MRSIEHAFSEPPPKYLYLDTDFLAIYFVPTHKYHARCQKFVERITIEWDVEVYVSSLTWVEFAHVVTRPAFRDELPTDDRARFHLDQWENDPSVRRKWLDFALGSLQALLAEFRACTEVPLTDAVRRAAVELIMKYNLGSQDAVHLASAQSADVLDFASFDRGYRRVDALHLWNDQIFGTDAS